MTAAQKEQKDRFVKMVAKRIKKMIAEDVRTRKFFDGKTDLEAEAKKIIQLARELARKEHEANRIDFPHLQYTRTESINKTDFPDDFILAEFYRQTGMRVSSIEVFEEITQEEYHEEMVLGFVLIINFGNRLPDISLQFPFQKRCSYD